ncbi:aldo/keto reductase [Gluconacetobacter sacchari DSM 12717]|uniref:Aldo/keto reductase n=2 Tax=Gluconacetobacter sacchari TaxID=92759 RepID=A0A7W4NP59_9PROT|nr:aldo/keto reductase [Gluconacetobacter sacchari]MBB2161429.1 aldo/keto reductase [Gluconacetobacter sacchari]GBQ26155.1 aldo/keto reductase [Gluconacetobacter sacchari DSM 12717]
MAIERFTLAPGYEISRIIKGGWHLAGGHGEVDRAQAVKDMAAFVEAGITTFDCADHYTGVEELIGDFRQACPSLAGRVQVQTKFVPDFDVLPTIDRQYITGIIDRSLKRLKVDCLDLVQFFWWDFAIPGAVETALVLKELMQAGKIARLGVTNFSVPQLRKLVDAGVPFVATQNQYSLIDQRPARFLQGYALEKGMKILTYGQLAGGFFSETWLGKAEPVDGVVNRSLIKYKLIIDDYGGWGAFQSLLRCLADIGRKHGVGIGEVAVRWVLDQPLVAGCIVGATSTRYLERNKEIFSFSLDEDDLSAIRTEVGTATGVEGDCYELENDRQGRHGRIMRYNQNQT